MEALIECLYAGDNNNAETRNLGRKEEEEHCQSHLQMRKLRHETLQFAQILLLASGRPGIESPKSHSKILFCSTLCCLFLSRGGE